MRAICLRYMRVCKVQFHCATSISIYRWSDQHGCQKVNTTWMLLACSETISQKAAFNL